MSLRFLTDQCVPAAIGRSLREHGHEVVALREVLHPRSPDDLVIAKAQELGCILLSLNGDFADIVTCPPANIQGIHCHSASQPRRLGLWPARFRSSRAAARIKLTCPA